MNLDCKWKELSSSLSKGGGEKTLRLSEHSVLELFLAIDRENSRYLVLHLPEDFQPEIASLENENILLRYISEKHLIAIKLLDADFNDLFNDIDNVDVQYDKN